MLTLNSSENNTDHIENFVRFGVNITGLKAKLAKKTYLLILLTNSLILLFSILFRNSENFENLLSNIFTENYIYLIIIGVILFLLIIYLKNSGKKFCNFLILIIWAFWLIYISLCFSYLFCSSFENFGYIYIVFFLHHFFVTTILVFKNEFNFSIVWINLVFSIFGIIFICVQKFWVISHFYLYLLICFQLFFVNIFYFVLIQFFNYYQEKKFWKKRSVLIFFIIFIVANLSLVCVFVIIFYVIFYIVKNKNIADNYFDKEESEINVERYFQAKD